MLNIRQRRFVRLIVSQLIVINVIFILNSICVAQNKKADSLLTLLKTDKADTNKVNHLNSLGWLLMYQNPDTSIILGNQALDIITPVHSPEFFTSIKEMELNGISLLRANTLDNLGYYYYLKTDHSKALDYYQKALAIDEVLKNKNGIGKRLGHIGMVYGRQGNYPKALDCFFKALKIDEVLENKIGIAKHLGNIGLIHADQGNCLEAIDYYLRAMKIDYELGDKRLISIHCGNIGVVYYNQKNYPKALDYYLKGLKSATELGDKYEVARHLANIGGVYFYQKDYPKALDNYFKALKMTEELGDKNNIAVFLANIGSIYIATGKFKEAEQYLTKAIILNDSIGAMKYLMYAEEDLSRLYDTTRKYKLALIHYKKAIALKDTLFSQENKKQLIRKEMNFEFDKKEAYAKAENDKQQAIATVEKNKQKYILILVSCVLALVCLFAGFIFRSLQITHRQKNLIGLQKNEMSQQKEVVEKQKEKIVDSITYAQRIQQSILMEECEIQNYLPDCFIYFQPKDIVSGDFYWCSKVENKIILAAVDCTGHGVPGAFMSMIGNTLLNQIVNEKQITVPSEILQLLNIGVYEALHQKKDGALSNDGMDIALCTIDYQNNEIQYAGAQNPLYIISDGEVSIIKANIDGIGGGGIISKIYDPIKKKFTNHVIPIKKDMSIYLFSDGYQDQFGGIDRRSFGTHKFKELLLNSYKLTVQQQKDVLISAHKKWRGKTVQIDDILVIGVKF